MSTIPSIPALAREAGQCLERKAGNRTSPATDQPILTSTDAAPAWVMDLFREAHGDMLPDDWKYEFIDDALESIGDCDDDASEDDIRDRCREDADGRYPYTATQRNWFASHLGRGSYVDDAVSELGCKEVDQAIAAGMFLEAEEVAGLILECLRERLEEIELEESEESAEESKP